MRVELPKIERCCCCMPLRRGILVFAYLNLLITIFFGVLQLLIWEYFYNNMKNQLVAMYRGVVIEAQMYFVVILHVLDVVFNIVLIVGAHKKNKKLMKVYYYYQLTTMVANFCAMLITYTDFGEIGSMRMLATLSECAVAFLGFVIQIYLLLLIHNEVNKQRYQEGRSSFVNQIAEVFVEPAVRQDRRNLL